MSFETETGRIIGTMAVRAIVNRINANKITPSSNKPQNRRTLLNSGILRNSIGFRVDNGKVIVSAGTIYAAIHHFGGVILPKKGKYLTFKVKTTDGKIAYRRVTKVVMPARPFMFLEDKDMEPMKTALANLIKRRFNE